MNQRAISASFESITMPSESKNVFVSYSHADGSLISGVVEAMRLSGSPVFQDIDGIRPGKRWRGEIADALATSHLVVVFWCKHASESNEVSKEWQAAIEQKKELAPFLMDATPLPPALAEFQWRDIRGTVGENHRLIGSKAARSRARWLFVTACAAVLGVGAVLAWFYSIKSVPHPNILSVPLETPAPWLPPLFPLETPAPWSPPPFPLETPAPWSLPAFPLESPAAAPRPPVKAGPLGHLLFPVIVLTVFIWLIYMCRKRPPGNIERNIAYEVEKEILRRTTSRR